MSTSFHGPVFSNSSPSNPILGSSGLLKVCWTYVHSNIQLVCVNEREMVGRCWLFVKVKKDPSTAELEGCYPAESLFQCWGSLEFYWGLSSSFRFSRMHVCILTNMMRIQTLGLEKEKYASKSGIHYIIIMLVHRRSLYSSLMTKGSLQSMSGHGGENMWGITTWDEVTIVWVRWQAKEG